VLVLLNAHHEGVPFVLPKAAERKSWLRVFDAVNANSPERRFPGGARYPLQGRTVAVFTLNGERRTRRVSDPGEKE
jgi:glycogen operon protein